MSVQNYSNLVYSSNNEDIKLYYQKDDLLFNPGQTVVNG